MSDYKLVPIDPAPEMVEAAEDAYMPFGDMELAIRMAVLAAPAVQGKPGALPAFATKIIEKLQRFNECAQDDQDVDIGRHWLDILTRMGLLNRVQRSPARWEIAQQGEDVLESYAAPQPAEQQPAPDVAQVRSYNMGLEAAALECDRIAKGHDTGSDFRAAFEFAADNIRELTHIGQPEPDVEALVEALGAMLAVRVVEADASYGMACAKAEQALAAHRKQGGE